jgi:hypothetical protein
MLQRVKVRLWNHAGYLELLPFFEDLLINYSVSLNSHQKENGMLWKQILEQGDN